MKSLRRRRSAAAEPRHAGGAGQSGSLLATAAPLALAGTILTLAGSAEAQYFKGNSRLAGVLNQKVRTGTYHHGQNLSPRDQGAPYRASQRNEQWLAQQAREQQAREQQAREQRARERTQKTAPRGNDGNNRGPLGVYLPPGVAPDSPEGRRRAFLWAENMGLNILEGGPARRR